MRFANAVYNILVREITVGDKESLVTGFRHFDGFNVSQGNVADIDVEEGARRRQLVLGVALDEVLEPLVGCVDSVEGVQVMHDRTEDKGRVNCGDVEVGIFVFNKVPCGPFREGLDQASQSISGRYDNIMEVMALPCWLCRPWSGPWPLPR